MKNISNKIVSIFTSKSRGNEKATTEKEIRIAIRKLKEFSDRDLKDIGIHRSNIEYAVRYGNAANDADPSQNSAA